MSEEAATEDAPGDSIKLDVSDAGALILSTALEGATSGFCEALGDCDCTGTELSTVLVGSEAGDSEAADDSAAGVSKLVLAEADSTGAFATEVGPVVNEVSSVLALLEALGTSKELCAASALLRGIEALLVGVGSALLLSTMEVPIVTGAELELAV